MLACESNPCEILASGSPKFGIGAYPQKIQSNGGKIVHTSPVLSGTVDVLLSTTVGLIWQTCPAPCSKAEEGTGRIPRRIAAALWTTKPKEPVETVPQHAERGHTQWHKNRSRFLSTRRRARAAARTFFWCARVRAPKRALP